MVNVASPSPKKTLKDTAKAVKHSPIKKAVRVSETVKTATPQTKKTTKTRRRKRKEGDWTYNEDERVYIVEPQRNKRPDVHKYTWIYLHHANGHPSFYFSVDSFQDPGLRVVLPKAPQAFKTLPPHLTSEEGLEPCAVLTVARGDAPAAFRVQAERGGAPSNKTQII